MDLTRLPDHILLEIFYQLDLYSLQNVVFTCQKIHSLCQNIGFLDKLTRKYVAPGVSVSDLLHDWSSRETEVMRLLKLLNSGGFKPPNIRRVNSIALRRHPIDSIICAQLRLSLWPLFEREMTNFVGFNDAESRLLAKNPTTGFYQICRKYMKETRPFIKLLLASPQLTLATLLCEGGSRIRSVYPRPLEPGLEPESWAYNLEIYLPNNVVFNNDQFSYVGLLALPDGAVRMCMGVGCSQGDWYHIPPRGMDNYLKSPIIYPDQTVDEIRRTMAPFLELFGNCALDTNFQNRIEFTLVRQRGRATQHRQECGFIMELRHTANIRSLLLQDNSYQNMQMILVKKLAKRTANGSMRLEMGFLSFWLGKRVRVNQYRSPRFPLMPWELPAVHKIISRLDNFFKCDEMHHEISTHHRGESKMLRCSIERFVRRLVSWLAVPMVRARYRNYDAMLVLIHLIPSVIKNSMDLLPKGSKLRPYSFRLMDAISNSLCSEAGNWQFWPLEVLLLVNHHLVQFGFRLVEWLVCRTIDEEGTDPTTRTALDRLVSDAGENEIRLDVDRLTGDVCIESVCLLNPIVT